MLYDFPRKSHSKEKETCIEEKKIALCLLPAGTSYIHLYTPAQLFVMNSFFWVMKNSHTVCIIYLGTLFDSKIKAEHV